MPHVKSPSFRCQVVLHVNVTESTEREKPKKSAIRSPARRGELPDFSGQQHIPVLDEEEDVLR